MEKQNETERKFNKLPIYAVEFIKLIIKKMRYRKKVREDVQAELSAHFEDELRDCATDKEKEQKAEQLIEQFGDAKLLGILLRRAKKRCRPLWRTVVAKTFQTTGVLIACLIVYVIWFLTGKPAITIDYVAELNRIVRPVTDDSLNAAPLFEQAALGAPNMPKIDSSIWHKRLIDVNETERHVLTEWVNQSSDSLRLIAEGTKKPHLWREFKTDEGPNVDGSMMDISVPNLAKFFNLGRALCWRAQLKASKGQYKDAFEDLITTYKFGRLIRQGEKYIIEQLVGKNVETLSTKNLREILVYYDISEGELATLQREFEAAKANENFTLCLSLEKLGIYDEIQRCFTEEGVGGGHLYLSQLHFDGGRLYHVGTTVYDDDDFSLSKKVITTLTNPSAWRDVLNLLFLHPDKYETHKQVDKVYGFYEQVAKITPWQLRHESRYRYISIHEQIEKIVEGNIFLRSLIPYLHGLVRLTYQAKADADATSAIISIIRYQKEKGSYPNKLKDLVTAGYLEKVPMDPFSSTTLIYRKTEDGFVLYSYGGNLQDDGGKVYRDDNGHVKLWEWDEDNGGDAVFWPVQK